jgi:hypothetical protein
MKKVLLVFSLLMFTSISFSQTLVQTYPFPSGGYWDQGYGLVYHDGELWYSSGSSTDQGKLTVLDLEANVLRTVQISYPGMRASQGLAHDGTNLWYVERKTARCDLFKVSPTGQVLDSIILASINGGTSWYVGGAAWDGTGLWVSVYSPDAQAALYKIDLTSKTIIDTLPVIGLQPTGITVKGDTLIYANDGFSSNGSQGIDRIYGVDMNAKDTLFSFSPPHPTNLTNAMRGLAWDGQHFWLMAKPVGSSTGRSLFKYDLGGSGTPAIQMITTIINFGDVQIDSVANAIISVRNYGTADLILDSAQITHIDFQLGIAFPFTITPGQTSNIPVSFNPKENKIYTDSVMFYHNDPNFQYSRTRFTGRGIYTSPVAGLSSTSIDFGNKRKNSTSYKELTVTNLGSQPLIVENFSLNSERFYLENAEFPFTVDSVKSKTFRIWFNPITYEEYKDTLKLISNSSAGTVNLIPLTGYGSSYDSTLGAVMWEYVPSSSAQIDAMYRISDINNDGVDDLVAYGQNFGLFALNGNSSGTADLLWVYHRNSRIDYYHNMQVVSDLNGDGYEDIVFGHPVGSGMVFAVSGFNGELIWSFGDSTNFSNGAIMGIDGRRDFNGDEVPDILISASGSDQNLSGRYSVILIDGATGAQLWRLDQSNQQKLKYNVTSLQDGGAVGSRSASSTAVGEVIGFDKQGIISWAFPTIGTPWEVVEIEDLNGDGISDVIAGTFSGQVYAISGDAGIQLWNTSIGNVIISELKIVDDIDGDDVQDIFVSGINPNVYLLSGRTGQVIWQQHTGGNVLSKAVIGDLNADGTPELIAGSLTVNNIIVFDGKQGTPLFNYSFGSGSSNPVDGVTIMGDVDQNGTFEFAAGTRGGRITSFSGGFDIPVFAGGNYIPLEYNLEQNYPNPFNPATIISYSIPEAAKVKITIYDILGKVVKTLVNEEQNPGQYQIEWNGTNFLNSKVSTGVYFYRLETGNFIQTKKMLMLK